MWVALLVAALSQQPVPDAFVARHDAAAALNPLSSRFTVALEGDRRAFRVGESIRLVLTYDGILNRRFLQGRSLRLLARTVLDHADGTSDPLAGSPGRADSIGGYCGCSEGGVVGGQIGGVLRYDENLNLVYVPPQPLPPPPPPPPVVLTMTLDDSVRFEKAGHYRLYLSDDYDQAYAYGNLAPPPIISNIIEIEITRKAAVRHR